MATALDSVGAASSHPGHLSDTIQLWEGGKAWEKELCGSVMLFTSGSDGIVI